SSNADVRWRAASDLAQVLLRDDQLSSDPKFALDLTERLQRALRSLSATEAALAQQAHRPDDLEPNRKQFEDERTYVLYLMACVGNVRVPVAVPVLKGLAERQEGADPDALAQRRVRAVWALANLGEHLQPFDDAAKERLQQGESLKRFGMLSPARQQFVLDRLAEEADKGGERGQC